MAKSTPKNPRGAGAKPKPYKTKPIGIRVPEIMHSEICSIVRSAQKKLHKKYFTKKAGL
jgi:hypothetical protein